MSKTTQIPINKLRKAFESVKLPQWNDSSLRIVSDWILGRIWQGMRELQQEKDIFHKFRQLDFGFGLPGLWGPDSENHSFRYCDYQVGFRLSEPQVTKALKYLLDKKSERCRAFVKALFAAGGMLEQIDEFRLDEMEDFLEIEAEFGFVSSDRSLDLFISWGEENKYVVAIENKLGHQITAGQLPAYKSGLEQKFKKAKMKLFVLAPDFSGVNANAMQRNREWFAVTWWNLMRYWEEILKEEQSDDDEDFHRLRRAFWSRGVEI